VISGSTVNIFSELRQMVGIDLSSGGDVGELASDLGARGANANGAFASSPVIWGDLFLIVDGRGYLEAYR
jgi:hypothetical protein